ncbi:MAG TPA: VWA domain-containing protein [Thermoanaerobaculia bacterium]|nr:VWA domain-containing protein [Thermoanaerobaculia bacterium]
MSRTRTLIASLLIALAITGTAAAQQKKPLIQVAVLLDTSNSMDGLIDQARTQLWRIVNELATAKKNGTAPDLNVALYEYGNSRLKAPYVRRVLALTPDLDKVSEELFALTTSGGEEYCGQVIDDATKELKWSGSNADLKLIFIAGNEPFTQGSVDFHQACKRAIAKGIVVNTIYCGEKNEGIRTSWKEGAELADGSYLSIDQNMKVAEIAAPQDKEIAALGLQLNKTYIAYGAAGAASAGRQSAQDANAVSAAPTANVQRQVAKASMAYKNSSWDVVDALNDGTLDLDKVPAKDLPKEMQSMTVAERKAYVAKKKKEREELQTKIRKLDEDRRKYVAEQMKKNPPKAGTLDRAVISAVRDSGTKKGYKFE